MVGVGDGKAGVGQGEFDDEVLRAFLAVVRLDDQSARYWPDLWARTPAARNNITTEGSAQRRNQRKSSMRVIELQACMLDLILSFALCICAGGRGEGWKRATQKMSM